MVGNYRFQWISVSGNKKDTKDGKGGSLRERSFLLTHFISL